MARSTMTRRSPQAVHGSCRWLGLVNAGLLEAGLARLQIRVVRAGQSEPVVTAYWVELNLNALGQRTGYRLLRDDGGVDVVAAYDIDTTFGPEPEHHTCTCPDFSRRRPGGCKHVRAIHAALTKANLLPPIPSPIFRPRRIFP